MVHGRHCWPRNFKTRDSAGIFGPGGMEHDGTLRSTDPADFGTDFGNLTMTIYSWFTY